MEVNLESDLEKSLQVLKNGGTLLYPTDTVWGLGCDATDANAVEKIIQLKKRPPHKSFVVLVADLPDLLKYVAAPDLNVLDYLESAPKPTTVIYQDALGLASNVLADDGSVAIRLCKDEFCRRLIRRFKKPIVSTSANFSGEPAPAVFPEIDTDIVKGVDYAVWHRREDLKKASPSAIIRWKNGNIDWIRK